LSPSIKKRSDGNLRYIAHHKQLSAELAGAKCARAYVNCATRLLGDGFALVQDMANVLKQTNTEILAPSIKSPSEAVKTLLARAHQKTLPFDVLQAMAVDELSQPTVDEFAKNGRGI
jgi:transaldolase